MSPSKLIVAFVLLVVIAGLLVGSCAVVPPGHRGVLVTLGKVSQDLKGEGLALKMPFISGIKRVSIQQETFSGDSECFSSDLQTLRVKYAILIRVPETSVIPLFQQYRGDFFPSLVEPRFQECVKQITAKYRAEECVKRREEMKAEVLTRLREEVGDILQIVDVNIANIDLTDELEKSIEAKVKEEQLALAKKFELQKEQTEAEITIVRATAEAESVRVRGEALKLSPEVVQLEIVKKWNGISPQTIVVGEGGANVLLPVNKK